jgi:hypothetical protein
MTDGHELLVHWLRQLNWKERYYLVDHALGTNGFKLGSSFREQLGDEIDVEVPANTFAAMDYHLDWMYAALTLSAQGIEADGHWDTPTNVATGSQLDTDLLVVFEQDGQTHVVMVEAKAKGAWDNKQMCKKVSRLAEVFGDGGDRWPDLTPHWVLMSARPARKYALDYWPRWMKKSENPDLPYWIGLHLPDRLSSLHQSDESGSSKARGEWFVVKTKSNN